MVRQSIDPEEVEAPTQKQKMARSPLGVYLITTGMSVKSIARAVGVKFITAQQWAYGEAMPTIPYAFEIERVTKGAVVIEAWLGMPKAKITLARIREAQPEEVRAEVLPPTHGAAGLPAAKKAKGMDLSGWTTREQSRKDDEYDEIDQDD